MPVITIKLECKNEIFSVRFSNQAMQLSIILVLFCAYSCYGSEIWYHTEMSTYLVPPFQSAYATLQRNVIDTLITTNEDTFTSSASTLYCEIEKILKNLDIAVTMSNTIRLQVDNKLINVANDISAKRNEIARISGQIQTVDTNIQEKQSQIRSAEESVRRAEGSVTDAQNALRRAENEMEDAKLCSGLIGRRRRFLGNLWNSIQESVLKPIESAANTAAGAIVSATNTVGNAIVDNVVKPVCGVVNVQQVDNAARNVENKKNDLALSRNRVQTLKNDLNSLQNDLIVFNAQLYNFNAQLDQLKNSLIELPEEQHIILLINQKLKEIAGHIRTSFGGLTTFLDAMTTMTSLESIVTPLNAIYDELQQNQFMVSFNTGKISTEDINQVKRSLQALTASLSTMPFNTGGTICSN